MKEYEGIFLIHFVPYVVITVFFYILIYLLLKNKCKRIKIQAKVPKKIEIIGEIGFSVISITLYALFVTIIFNTPLIQYSKIYTKISDFSIYYFIFTIALSIVLQDTWFYWTHRLIHNKHIFPYVHLVHHRFTNPTPFAAYAFHPAEAFVQALIFYLILFIIPVHPSAVFIAVNISLLINAYGHLGYEIFPPYILNTFLFKIINSSVYHNMHHQNFYGNYGLYFRFWDKLMGTEFENYEKKFEEIVTNVRSI